MRKTKFITAAFSLFFILLADAVKLVEEKTKYSFLIGNLNSDGLICVFLICSCICLVISVIAAFASKKEKHIVINSLIRIILITGILSYALSSGILTADNEYYKFTSPDKEYSVIAEEWSFLLGGGVVFYERENAFLVIEKESFNTDDGYRVISAGNYSVEWNENIMAFTGSNGNNIYKTVEIELSK